MRLLCKYGIFSTVQQKNKSEILLVQARLKEELESFAKKMSKDERCLCSSIFKIPHTTYPFRMEMPKKVFAKVAERITSEDPDACLRRSPGEKTRRKRLQSLQEQSPKVPRKPVCRPTNRQASAQNPCVPDISEQGKKAIPSHSQTQHGSGPDNIIPSIGNEDVQSLFSFLSELDARERMILQLRFGLDGRRPKTLEEVSQMIHRTRERVRQLQNTGLAKLRAKLQMHLSGFSPAAQASAIIGEPEEEIDYYCVYMKDDEILRFEDGQEYRKFIREHQEEVSRTEVIFKKTRRN